jgi:hypothetical protein
MLKYKMTQSDKCPRCGVTETINHLLWECHHAKLIWNEYNNFMTNVSKQTERVNNYKEIYIPGDIPATALIKIKVTQELIQMNRPTNWSSLKMENLVKELINMEKYIAKENHDLTKFLKKWNFAIHQ